MTYIRGLGLALAPADLAERYRATADGLEALLERHPGVTAVPARSGGLALVVPHDDNTYTHLGWIEPRSGELTLLEGLGG